MNDAPERDRDWVLYWMIAARRPGWSFALQRAAEVAAAWGRPLVVLEPLGVDYRWASARLHRFVVDGMADNRAAFAGRVAYYPYLEPRPGAGRGLLAALARRACLVVTDDTPLLHLPRAIAAAGAALDVRLEAVDGDGLFPARATERAFTTAASFRRFLQKTLHEHLDVFPAADPLGGRRLPRPWLPHRRHRGAHHAHG